MMELCTESSHINPPLGPGLLLSLPPMSFCLFCLCLCHSVCCSCCIYFSLSACFLHFFASPPPNLPIPLPFSLLSFPSNHSKLQICLTVLSLEVIDTCPEPVLLTSTGGQCLAGGRVGTTKQRWRWDCRTVDLRCACLCCSRVGRY